MGAHLSAVCAPRAMRFAVEAARLHIELVTRAMNVFLQISGATHAVGFSASEACRCVATSACLGRRGAIEARYPCPPIVGDHRNRLQGEWRAGLTMRNRMVALLPITLPSRRKHEEFRARPFVKANCKLVGIVKLAACLGRRMRCSQPSPRRKRDLRH